MVWIAPEADTDTQVISEEVVKMLHFLVSPVVSLVLLQYEKASLIWHFMGMKEPPRKKERFHAWFCSSFHSSYLFAAAALYLLPGTYPPPENSVEQGLKWFMNIRMFLSLKEDLLESERGNNVRKEKESLQQYFLVLFWFLFRFVPPNITFCLFLS